MGTRKKEWKGEGEGGVAFRKIDKDLLILYSVQCTVREWGGKEEAKLNSAEGEMLMT